MYPTRNQRKGEESFNPELKQLLNDFFCNCRIVGNEISAKLTKLFEEYFQVKKTPIRNFCTYASDPQFETWLDFPE